MFIWMCSFCVRFCLFDALWCDLNFLNLTLWVRTLINCTLYCLTTCILLSNFRFYDYKLKLYWCLSPSVQEHIALGKEIVTYNQKIFRVFSKDQRLGPRQLTTNQLTVNKLTAKNIDWRRRAVLNIFLLSPKPSCPNPHFVTKSLRRNHVTKSLLRGQFVRSQFVAVSWLGSKKLRQILIILSSRLRLKIQLSKNVYFLRNWW